MVAPATDRIAALPFECPRCDVFPFGTAAELGEHVAAHTPAAAPQVTASGKFEVVDNGFGGATTRRIPQQTGGNGPTEKQISYAVSLAESRLAVDAEGRYDEVISVAALLARTGFTIEDAVRKMSRRDASAYIDTLLSTPKMPRTTSTPAASTSAAQTLSEGMYRVDESIYKVQKARRTGNLYAKRLDGSIDDGFSFEYEQGAIRTVRERGVRLTLDEAKQFGQRTGTCCVCTAVLTNPESIALGIGPICGGRL